MIRYAYVPLPLGLMIGPTLSYEIGILEWEPITIRGFPLPWNGDALARSGPPVDVYIIPAIFDLLFYVTVCALIWRRIHPRLERSGVRVRSSVVTIIWLYSLVMVSLLSLGIAFGGSWMIWYANTEWWEGVLDVGIVFGV